MMPPAILGLDEPDRRGRGLLPFDPAGRTGPPTPAGPARWREVNVSGRDPHPRGGDKKNLDPGRRFDVRMAGYLNRLRTEAISRRGLLRSAGGAAGAAALAGAAGVSAGPRPFLPGLSVLKQEG